jgi:VCBS repeat-containing protein
MTGLDPMRVPNVAHSTEPEFTMEQASRSQRNGGFATVRCLPWLVPLLLLAAPGLTRAARPTISTVQTLSGATEDTAFTITYMTLTNLSDAMDADGDPLSFRIESVSSGTLTQGGSPVTNQVSLLSSTSPSLVWLPGTNAFGTVLALRVKAYDGNQTSTGTADVNVNVNGTPDAPTLTSVANLANATEDTPFTITYQDLINAGDEMDPDGDTLSFVLASLTTGTLTLPGGGAVTVGSTLATGGSWIWLPATNANGTLDAFKVRVTDGTLSSGQDVPVRATVAAVNDPPTLTGSLAGTTMGTAIPDSVATNLFTGLTIADVDSATVTVTVNLSFAAAELGSFQNTPDPSSLTLTGTPQAVTTALRTNLFEPIPNVSSAGVVNSFGLVLNVRDAGGADAVGPLSGTNQVYIQSINDAPTASLSLSPNTITDRQDVQPFHLTISDPDGGAGDTYTVSVAIANIAPVTSPGVVFGTLNPPGPYSGTKSVVESTVGTIQYRPVRDSVDSNQVVEFRFTVTDAGNASGTAAAQLSITGQNEPPDIIGVPTTVLRITDDATDFFPFQTVRIEDVDSGGQQLMRTVTISVSDPSKGQLVAPGPFTNVTPSEATDLLRMVRFIPDASRIPVGNTESVTLTITVEDVLGAVRSNNKTTVAITSVNGAPKIRNVPLAENQPKLVPPILPVTPFLGIVIEDDDTNLTVTVSLDIADKGSLVSTNGFAETSAGSGVYVFQGSPAQATMALTNLQFEVNPVYPFPPNEPGGTTFTITAADSALNMGSASLFIVLQNEPRNHFVTHSEDDWEEGSLRRAVTNAANNDVITFALPSYPALIRLDAGLGPIEITRNLSLKGPGADLLTISGDTDGNLRPDTQLFRVEAAVALEGLTLTQGKGAETPDGPITGGAIYVGSRGRLLLRYCAVTDCQADQWGGGIDVDQGSLDLENCLVRNNATDSAVGLGGGGISLYTDLPCSFVNTTFSTNRQSSPTGFGGGAIYAENYDPGTELIITIEHCTFAENRDEADLGSSVNANVFGTKITLRNSIFADGQSRNLEVQGAGRILSAGGNLSDDTTTTFLTQGGQPKAVVLLDQGSDRTQADPLLGPLNAHLRPLPAYPLQTGSPAIGAAVGPKIAVDQRGLVRDDDPDSGAVELDASLRLVLNEIQFNPGTGDQDYLEFYVLRDSTAFDLSGYTVWVDGTNRYRFAPGTVVQPGRGIVVADGSITAGDPVNMNPTVVVTNVTGQLSLQSHGLVELHNPTNGSPVLSVTYLGVFADPSDPTTNLVFPTNSLTLAPQFLGFAYLPHSVVLPGPFEGADLGHGGAARSPGRDTAETPFGSPNAFPIAQPDEYLVNEDLPFTAFVLDNDLDADGLDRLVVVDLSNTSGLGGTNGSLTTAQNAFVRIDSTTLPLPGGDLLYDPRSSSNLQSLAEGARRQDQFYYEIVDYGTGPILDYEGASGDPKVTIVSPAHRLVTNDVIIISGAGLTNYDGEFPITPVAGDPDRFTIQVPYVGRPTLKGSWVTKDPRHPTEHKEALVTLTVLGANDPPLPVPDQVTNNVTEETVVRIMADPLLAGINVDFDTDNQYPVAPLNLPVSLLANDADPDSDDNSGTLFVVGVLGQVHMIADYAPASNGAAVLVTSPQHGLENGTVILISLYGGHPSYDGYHAVTVLDQDTFTIPVAYVDDAAAKGVWGILNDDNRLETVSARGATVRLEIRTDRIETSVVYNPRTSTDLNGLSAGSNGLDTFFYAVEDRHGAVSLAPVLVTVQGVNDLPEVVADPGSVAGLDSLVQTNRPLDQILAQLEVLYSLPPASGLAGRADAEVRFDDNGSALDFFLEDLWTTDEDTPLQILSTNLLANDSDLDRSDVLRVKSVAAQSREGANVTLSGNGQTITYDPTASASLNSLAREEKLIDTVEITVTDDHGGDVTSLVSVLVVGANDTPEPQDDLVSTFEDMVLVFNPILNPTNNPALQDRDPDVNGVAPDNRLSLIGVTNAPTDIPGAFVTISGDQFAYDPTQSSFLNGLAQGQTVQDTYVYTVMDGSFIFANDDLFKVEADSQTNQLSLLVNDRNLTGNGSPLTIVAVGTPNHGATVVITNAGTQVLYTPEVNFVGDEIFTYMVSDAFGNTDSGLVTVRVTVNQLNGNLQANADHFAVAKGEAPALDVLANDNILPASGADLIITRIVSGPDRMGTAVPENNRITYAPNASVNTNYPYTETFTYEVSGGGSARALAEVTIQVVNREGALHVRDDAFSIQAGSGNNDLDVLFNDSILPGTGESLTIRNVLTNQVHGLVTINEAGTALVYAPPAAFVGSDTFAYVATDSLGGTGTGMVSIAVGVLAANSDFFTVPYDDPLTNVDDGPVVLDVLANDGVLQSPQGLLTITNVTPTNSVLGTMTVGMGWTNLLFDPAPGQQGDADFTYTITDGFGRTAVGNVTVVVLAGQGVKANSDAFTVAVDSTGNELDVLTNDVAIPNAGRRLSIVKVGDGLDAPNQGGTVTVNETNDRLLYTPAPGFSGEEIFTYTMTDSKKTDTAKVVIKVTAGELSANEDAFTVFLEPPSTNGTAPRQFTLSVLANDRVVPDLGQLLTITGVGIDDVNGTNAPNRQGDVSISPDGATLLYVPNDFIGPFPYFERFTYEISDGTARRAQASVSVQVLMRTATLVLESNPDAFTVAADSQTNVLAVLANDNVKPAGASSWQITSVSVPTNGVAFVSGSVVLYTPQPGFVGTDGFTYSVSDGFGGTASAEVIVKVGDLPLAQDVFTALSGSTNNVLDVLANDAIRPATAAEFLLFSVDTPTRNGTASISNGKVLYAPDPAYTNLYPYREDFLYTVEDDSMGMVTGKVAVLVYQAGSDRSNAVVRIDVNGVNDLPVITGARSGQTVYYLSSIQPFAGVKITEYDDQGQEPLVVTVTLDDATHGKLTSLGQFVDAGGGVYSLGSPGQGVTAAEATSALHDLVFVPTADGRVHLGASETTRFTIAVQDPFAPPVEDANSSVVAVYPYIKKLLNADGSSGDEFGFALATTRDLIAVGAPFDDPLGSDSGSVYLLARNQGGPNQWGRLQTVLPNDGRGGDQFGYSVALSGRTLVVGARFGQASGRNSGTAYIFEPSPTNANVWVQTRKIAPADGAANDLFGFSVAINGDTVLVGSRRDDDLGDSSGSAYLFERNKGGSNAWGQADKILASNGSGADEFGFSVSISGDALVVGAPVAMTGTVTTGSAYVFQRNPTNSEDWIEVKILSPVNGAANDQFGLSLGISGDTIAVGAPMHRDGAQSGAAFIYQRNQDGPDQWGRVAKLLPFDGADHDEFGFSLALDEDYLVVGSRKDDDNGVKSGSAYVYGRRPSGTGSWSYLEKWLPPDGDSYDQFGFATALRDNTAVVGARYDDATGHRFGSTYVYRLKFNNAPSVVMPPSDQVFVADTPLTFTVPPEFFGDPDLKDQVVLSATLADGSPLPAWLTFDPATGTFTGTPTETGDFFIFVTATDVDGATVTALFTLSVLAPADNGGGIVWEVTLGLTANPASSEIVVSYQRPLNALAGQYHWEASDDLVAWADFPVQTETVTAVDATTETVTIRVDSTSFPGGVKFFRVRLEP